MYWGWVLRVGGAAPRIVALDGKNPRAATGFSFLAWWKVGRRDAVTCRRRQWTNRNCWTSCCRRRVVEVRRCGVPSRPAHRRTNSARRWCTSPTLWAWICARWGTWTAARRPSSRTRPCATCAAAWRKRTRRKARATSAPASRSPATRPTSFSASTAMPSS